MKLTNSILLSFAASITAASAATTLISSDPTTYTDNSTGEGNWHYQTLTLNDGGFTRSGDALGATATLNSITFVHDEGNVNAGDIYLVVMSDINDINSILAQSTNTVDVAGTVSTATVGGLMTWNFADDVLDTTTQLFFAWYTDDSADGTIGTGDNTAQARVAGQGNLIAGGTAANPAGGSATNVDSMMNIQLNVIPEPSSSALLGLGGLALILRRRK